MAYDQSDDSLYLDDNSVSPHLSDEDFSQDPADWLENARRCGEHQAMLARRVKAHHEQQFARVTRLREGSTRKRSKQGLSVSPLAGARQALTALVSTSDARSVNNARNALNVLYAIDSSAPIVVSQEEASIRRLLGIVVRAKLVAQGQHRKQWRLAHAACIALRAHRREIATARSSRSV